MPSQSVVLVQKRYSQVVIKTKEKVPPSRHPGGIGPCQAVKGWPSGRYLSTEEKKRMAG